MQSLRNYLIVPLLHETASQEENTPQPLWPKENQKYDQTNLLIQPNSSTMAWLQRQTRMISVKQSSRPDESQSNVRMANFRKAEGLLNRTETLIGEVDDILFGPTRNTRTIVKEKFDALSTLLNEIHDLTQTFDPDAPMLSSPQNPTLSVSSGKAIDSTIEKEMVDKCLDIVNALPHLCNAMEWSKYPRLSLLDYCYSIDESRPLSPDEIDDMVTHAALAHTVYADPLETNLEKAQPLLGQPSHESFNSMPMPTEVRTSFENICPHLQHLDDGRFCDPDSGLVGQIFFNERTNEIRIAFGGTSSGQYKGTLMERLWSNAWITARQWRANISSATGMTVFGDAVPDSYSRAAKLASLMKEFSVDDGKGIRISLTGHSKGGAEAEYAALKNQLPAVCFCTPELGKSVLASASESDLRAGARNIRHYFVNGDPTPHLGSLASSVLGRRQAHVGTTFSMGPDPEIGDGPLKSLWYHDLFYVSALHEAARQLNHSDPQE